MVRRRMSRGRDRRVFRATAKKSKRVNIAPTTYRGGIRL